MKKILPLVSDRDLRLSEAALSEVPKAKKEIFLYAYCSPFKPASRAIFSTKGQPLSYRKILLNQDVINKKEVVKLLPAEIIKSKD